MNGRGTGVEATVLGGRYRLEGLVGRGGMASVWRATDVVLERPVAVKRLHTRLQDDPELAQRFRREARVVARLSHPNLVRLLDQGDEGGEPFLVFELVEGEDLKARIKAVGRLDPHEAARIAADVGRALHSAHGQGVVHRDIKSHNVLLTYDGQAKLTDFGIARIAAHDEGSLTRAGIVIGTSDYLAPEQAEGREADVRSDVYSLGVVLYECLTGELPFHGEHAVAVATQHVHEPMPDPRVLAPGTPPSLAAVVRRATAKDPERRFASAGQMVSALDGGAGATALMPIPEQEEGPTGEIPRVRRGRRVLGVTGAGLVLAAAAGGVLWWQGLLPGSKGVTSASAVPGVPLSIASVKDEDPQGDHQEHPDLLRNLTDGNRDTAWTTEGYRDSPTFAGKKTGVGLELALARPARATQLVIDSPTAGSSFEVKGPGTPADPGPVIARGTLKAGPQTVALRTNRSGSGYLLWFTRLAPDPTSANTYRAEVGEVALRGVPNR